MYCSNCGTENIQEANFCRNCGSKILNAEILDRHADDAVRNVKHFTINKKRKTGPIVLFSTILLIAVLIFLFFIGSQHSQEPYNLNDSTVDANKDISKIDSTAILLVNGNKSTESEPNKTGNGIDNSDSEEITESDEEESEEIANADANEEISSDTESDNSNKEEDDSLEKEQDEVAVEEENDEDNIEGRYKGFNSNGQIAVVKVYDYDDYIKVIDHTGTSCILTKLSEGIYLNNSGVKCVFNKNNLMLQNAIGQIYYFEK